MRTSGKLAERRCRFIVATHLAATGVIDLGDGADQGQHLTARSWGRAGQEQGQFPPFARGHKGVERAGVAGLQAFKEPGDRRFQRRGRRMQAGSADTIAARLVFLDLLERDADRGGQVDLADPSDLALEPDARADVPIDGVGADL